MQNFCHLYVKGPVLSMRISYFRFERIVFSGNFWVSHDIYWLVTWLVIQAPSWLGLEGLPTGMRDDLGTCWVTQSHMFVCVVTCRCQDVYTLTRKPAGDSWTWAMTRKPACDLESCCVTWGLLHQTYRLRLNWILPYQAKTLQNQRTNPTYRDFRAVIVQYFIIRFSDVSVCVVKRFNGIANYLLTKIKKILSFRWHCPPSRWSV